MTSEYCDFTSDGALCVLSPGHAVRYHHLNDGRSVDVEASEGDASETSGAITAGTEFEEAS